MKRYLAILLVLVTGCGKKEPQYLKEYEALAAKQPELLAEAKKLGIPVGIDTVRSRRTVKPNQNAAADYRSIDFNEIEVPPDSPITSLVKYEATKRDAKGAERQFKGYAKWMQLADAATDKPDCDFNRSWTQGIRIRFPEYSVVRRLAKLYCARIYLDARSKDYAKLAKDIERTYRLAYHTDNDPGLISFLVVTAIRHMVNTQIRIILQEVDLNLPLVQALAKGIDRASHDVDFNDHMFKEYVLTRYIAKAQLVPPKNADEAAKTLNELKEFGTSSKTKDSLYRSVGQPARLCMKAHDARMLEFLIASHRSMKTNNQIEAVLEITRNADSMIADKRPGSFLSEYFNLAFISNSYGAHQQAICEAAVTRAVLKVFAVRFSSGQFPPRITDIDPFDGKPLDYQHTDDGFKVASRCRQMSYGNVLIPKSALSERRKRLLHFEYKNRP